MEQNSIREASPKLSFSDAVRQVFNKYATFKGRARRSEYWWFVLFYCLVLIAAALLDNLFGITIEHTFYGAIYCIAALVLFLPNLTVTVRRLHDINKSGWNILWGIIPLIGSILLIVWCCQDSKAEANQYGESPKYLVTIQY